MSVNILQEDGLHRIAGSVGNTEEIENKLQELETLIEQTKQLRADLESYGMVKLSNATNITDSTGLALPATEKNRNLPGTLANWIMLGYMGHMIDLNFNNYKASGIWENIGTNQEGSLNVPDPGDNGYLVVIGNNYSARQIWVGMFVGKFRTRVFLGVFGTWSDWKTIQEV